MNTFDYRCDAIPNCGWQSTDVSRPIGNGTKVICPNCSGAARFIGGAVTGETEMTFDTAFERSHPPDYRKPHVFDPIHNGADECECGLTKDADIHESDEAHEERMRPRVVNAPERIWLQVGCDDEVGEIDWSELSHSDVSWCGEKIHNTDIEYVRADLLATVRAAAFKEAIEIASRHKEHSGYTLPQDGSEALDCRNVIWRELEAALSEK